MTNPTVPDALLPCPFCGDHIAIKPWHEHWAIYHNTNGCLLETVDDYLYDTYEQAFAAWNRRAGQHHDAGLLAALEAIVAQSRVGDGSKPVTFSGRVNYPAPLLFAARAAIRAHIETLRAGGERAQIVEWLRNLHWTHRDAEPAKRIADAILTGADQG